MRLRFEADALEMFPAAPCRQTENGECAERKQRGGKPAFQILPLATRVKKFHRKLKIPSVPLGPAFRRTFLRFPFQRVFQIRRLPERGFAVLPKPRCLLQMTVNIRRPRFLLNPRPQLLPLPDKAFVAERD